MRATPRTVHSDANHRSLCGAGTADGDNFGFSAVHIQRMPRLCRALLTAFCTGPHSLRQPSLSKRTMRTWVGFCPCA